MEAAAIVCQTHARGALTARREAAARHRAWARFCKVCERLDGPDAQRTSRATRGARFAAPPGIIAPHSALSATRGGREGPGEAQAQARAREEERALLATQIATLEQEVQWDRRALASRRRFLRTSRAGGDQQQEGR